ncbi:MAG: polysaccharide deacetylase family protein [Clostridia bacterium]|nr:polysaccharide deacetylase family protein [Clostridia bacterium]
MFNGKMKAITFSYDDCTTQDIRLIELFNKYGAKATFNINSELLGNKNELIRKGVKIRHDKLSAKDIKKVYEGHEVAVHTLTHPCLQDIEDDNEIIRQIEEDRKNLEAILGYKIEGMAYPCHGNNAERVAQIIKTRTEIKYARTTISTFNFDLQENLYQFNPTVHHDDFDNLFKLGEEFLRLKPDSPKLFYIWGHSFEFDIFNDWDKFEEFLKLVCGKDDIFYGTNREVLL